MNAGMYCETEFIASTAFRGLDQPARLVPTGLLLLHQGCCDTVDQRSLALKTGPSSSIPIA
jgi:hypothetical protein